MPVRLFDSKAYENIYLFEILLRKVLRWELRGVFGRNWLSELGRFGTVIVDRIDREKRLGAYNADHSDLAYLDLSELLDLVFEKFWEPIFSAILKRKNLQVPLRRQIVAIRNKVAHFRAVDQKDLLLLQAGGDFNNVLDEYYSRLAASAYLSGEDPEGQLGGGEVDLLIRELAQRGMSEIWAEYGALEGVRAKGFLPGIGIVGHHLLFELFTTEAYTPESILEFAKAQRFDISFLNFGAQAEYVRIFVPFKLGEKAICKLMRAFIKSVSSANIVENIPTDYLDGSDFDMGYWEHVSGGGRHMHFGLVF